MSQKRKDHKGRILKTGESQRKDLIYQYRYTDGKGVRRTIYDADLQELRRKAKHIQTAMDDGIDYEAGQITVMELLKRYVALKQGVRYNTRVGYQHAADQMVQIKDFQAERAARIAADMWAAS